MPKDDFTADDFKPLWHAFLSKLKGKDTAAFNVLQTAKWRITTEQNIELTFDSSVMIFELDKYKQRFLKTIRTKLNNFGILIETKISQSKKTKNHIKTRRQKFDELVEKNPHIDILRKTFGLDIENEP